MFHPEIRSALGALKTVTLLGFFETLRFGLATTVAARMVISEKSFGLVRKTGSSTHQVKMYMRAKAVSCVLFLLLARGFGLGQQKTPAQWKEYTYPNDGFAITLPIPPNINESYALPGATAYFASLKSDDSDFVLRVMHKKGNCTAALAKMKEIVLSGKDLNTDVSSLKEPSIDRNPGSNISAW
jgi:hypothetical protein